MTQARTAQADLLFSAVTNSRVPLLLTDPTLPDNPIVLANRAVCALTGYAPQELIGHNCRMLQGDLTDPAAVARLGEAIAQAVDCTVILYNYRKDGTGFWNEVFIGPVFDAAGRLAYFLGAQLDVTARVHGEDSGPGGRPPGPRSEAGREFSDLLTVVLTGAELTAAPSGQRQALGLERAVRTARRAGHLTALAALPQARVIRPALPAPAAAPVGAPIGAGASIGPPPNDDACVGMCGRSGASVGACIDGLVAVLQERGVATTIEADPDLRGRRVDVPQATAVLLLAGVARPKSATLGVKARLAGGTGPVVLTVTADGDTLDSASRRLAAEALAEWGGRLRVSGTAARTVSTIELPLLA